MTISDAVVGNLTLLYFIAIAAIKVYCLAMDRTFTGFFVLIASTLLLSLIFVASLTWDISRKAIKALMSSSAAAATDCSSGNIHEEEVCRGGICWHGVAVKSPASQVRFSLPQHVDYRTHQF